jgi:hypothetical protein
MLIYVNITGRRTDGQTHQNYSSEPHNTFEKNKKIQIRVKILPKNVFENTKTKTFQALLIYSLLILILNDTTFQNVA